MFSERIEFLKRAYERATPQIRRPAYIGMAVLAFIGALAMWGVINTRNPLSMPSALGGIAVSQAIWGLKPSNLLMVLPIGSFLVVLARSFVGLKAFGLFTPMLIALAFLQIGPIFGPITLATSVGVGMAVAPSLLKLRMTRVGFLGVLISLVVFVLAALQGILDTELQVDAMPVVVTALVVERWYRQWEKDGYFEAAHIAFNTMMLALVIQFVMVSELALRLIEVSPLLLPGFAAIAITILGRYRGLRMTEIGRFFPIWYEGWMKRMGKEPTPVEEAEIMLAARAEIDKPHPYEDDEPEVLMTLFPARRTEPGRPLILRALNDRRASPPENDRRKNPPQAARAAANDTAQTSAADVVKEDIEEIIAARQAKDEAFNDDTFMPESAFGQSLEPTVGAEIEPTVVHPAPSGEMPVVPAAVREEAPESPAATKDPQSELSRRPDTGSNGRLTSVDWDKLRAELTASIPITGPGTSHVQPARPADAPLPPYAEPADRPGSQPDSGGLGAIFAQRASIGRLVEPALLGLIGGAGGRDPGDQPAQRDHREVQSASRDRAGARQGGGEGGAGGARGGNLWNDRRGLRLWTA